MNIILASGSPRRKELLYELLHRYYVNFNIIVSDTNEEDIKSSDLSPDKIVEKLSFVKAIDIYNKTQKKDFPLCIIAADTIVSMENEILGKPLTEENAKQMLRKIQGKPNDVYTGMTVIIQTENTIIYKTVSTKSRVYMANMTENDICEYVSTKEPLDKAGAYAIQGIGKKYIERYEGSFYSIVGLDVKKLENILKSFKII